MAFTQTKMSVAKHSVIYHEDIDVPYKEARFPLDHAGHCKSRLTNIWMGELWIARDDCGCNIRVVHLPLLHGASNYKIMYNTLKRLSTCLSMKL